MENDNLDAVSNESGSNAVEPLKTSNDPVGTHPESGVQADAEAQPKAVKAPTRSRRKPAAKKADKSDAADIGAIQDIAPAETGHTDEAAQPVDAAEAVNAAEDPENKKPVRRRRTTKLDVADAPGASEEEAGPAVKKPVRRRKAAVKKAVEAAAGTAEEAIAPEGATGDSGPQASANANATNPDRVQDTTSQDTTIPDDDDAAPAAESSMSLLFQAPDLTAVQAAAARKSAAKVVAPADADEDDDESDGGRRRKRSRRGRGRTKDNDNTDRNDKNENAGSADNNDGNASSQYVDAAESSDDDADEDRDSGEESNGATDNGSVTSRRRRRRRRGEQDLELSGGDDDDPPNTVTRVRAPRQHAEPVVSDKVTSVKGSTRLEAKKQRRRESRDTGRRRQVITEAEFLARRESVDRHMVVRQRDDRIQIGVLEDGVLAEHFVSKTQQDSLIGNVYIGKVQNVLPSMEAAFVDIGRGRNAVLYAGEVNWDAANMEGKPRRIELALKSGDSVLVQVSKDPVGHKGARLTSQISLPGRYLVYVPGSSMTGISRKLPDVERNRLKRILKDHLPANAGVIVRTAAEGASEEELMNDINRLRAQWENIEAKSTSNKTLPPELLYGEPDLTIKVVRDVFNEDFSKLIVSGEEAWDTIEAYVTYVAPDLVDRLEKWTKDEDIFAASRIDEQIAKALDRKVFLPSGGSLVIDRTEAMTVVDVNTGKYTGSGGNLEETVTKNNLEAAEEVVRQLRLRDIGGIIVIDFIDMVLEANRDLVLRRMVECLGRDRTKHQVAEVTSLGLVQMTRKRMGTGLLEVFGENCEHCAGRGIVTHDEPVEHKRAHAVSGDNHSQHLQEKQTRNERKRRGRDRDKDRDRDSNKQNQEPQESSAADSAVPSGERDARAEATRAAVANIAAATHATHEFDESPSADKSVRGASPVDGRPSAADRSTTADNGTVLTLHGQAVALPESAGARNPATEGAEPPLTLDSLTEAFDRRPADAGNQSGTGTGTGTSRRRKGRRVASSAQGSGSTESITTAASAPERPANDGARYSSADSSAAATPAQDAVHSPADQAEPPQSEPTQSAEPAQQVAPAKPSAEPVILGVGVSASDL